MRIAFVSDSDLADRKATSGSPHYMARALEKYAGEVVPLGPIRPPIGVALRAFAAMTRRLGGKRYDPYHSPEVARAVARRLRADLTGGRFDAIFTPNGSTLIARLDTTIPIAYASDTTFHQICGFYPSYTNLMKRSLRAGDDIERAALRRAALVLYPTEWAARDARDHYGADAAKIHVVPWGANLDDPPDASVATRKRESRFDPLRLLFIGVRWRDKGGDVALAALRALRDRGVPAELTICGTVPPAGSDGPGLRVIPFLDKNDPGDRARMDLLYREAHLFILPVRNECFGYVFCEANAFGVPALASRVGGVPCVIEEGKNGLLLPPGATGGEYADTILRLIGDRRRYGELVDGSRRAFETRLNWDAWGREVARLLRGAVEARAAGVRRPSGGSPAPNLERL